MHRLVGLNGQYSLQSCDSNFHESDKPSSFAYGRRSRDTQHWCFKDCLEEDYGDTRAPIITCTLAACTRPRFTQAIPTRRLRLCKAACNDTSEPGRLVEEGFWTSLLRFKRGNAIDLQLDDKQFARPIKLSASARVVEARGYALLLVRDA